jgi:hypothetical protein
MAHPLNELVLVYGPRLAVQARSGIRMQATDSHLRGNAKPRAPERRWTPHHNETVLVKACALTVRRFSRLGQPLGAGQLPFMGSLLSHVPVMRYFET